MAVAVPLQPFLKVPNTTDPHEVDDGIYNFLSPTLERIETRRFVVVREKEDKEVVPATDVPSSGTAEMDESIGTGGDLSIAQPASDPSSSSSSVIDANGNNTNATTQPQSKYILRGALKQVRPTEWYQKGQHVLDLIREAEKLDWSEDVQRAKRERSSSVGEAPDLPSISSTAAKKN